MASALTHLAMHGLLARLLTPASMGSFLVISSVAVFLGVVAQFGLGQASVRSISYARARLNPEEVRSSVSDAISLGLISASLVGFILYSGLWAWVALSWFDAPELAELVPYVSAWVFLIAMNRLFGELLRGLGRSVLAILFDSTRPFLPSLAISLALLANYLSAEPLSLSVVMLLILGCYATAAVGSLLLLRSFVPRVQVDRSISNRRALGVSAWPFMVHEAVWLGGTSAGLWVLATFATKPEVAFYGAAFLLSQVVAFPMVVMYALIPPRIAELHARGERAAMGQLLRTAATLAAVPGLIALGVALVFGEQILHLVFGAEYVISYPILLMFGIGQLLNLWSGASGIALGMTGNERTLMWITIPSALLTFGAALALVQGSGAVGVAIAYSAGLSFQSLASVSALRVREGMWGQMYLLPGTLKFRSAESA